MLEIRKNVFETNSSSTHSLAVPQNYSVFTDNFKPKKHKLTFNLGCFGRPAKTREVKPTDYLYTVIMEELNYVGYRDVDSADFTLREALIHSSEAPDIEKYAPKVIEKLNRLKTILNHYKVEAEFEKPVWEVEYDWDDEATYSFLKPSQKGAEEIEDRRIEVDHPEQAIQIVDMLLANPEECMKFLFGGKVFVGSDEADDVECAKVHWNEKTYTEAYYYNTKLNKEVKHYDYSDDVELRYRDLPNPYYLEGYNYYYKGN